MAARSQSISVLPGERARSRRNEQTLEASSPCQLARGSPKAGVIWHWYSNHIFFAYPSSTRKRSVLSFMNDSRSTFAESSQGVETTGTRLV